jgi:hypothetical protein
MIRIEASAGRPARRRGASRLEGCRSVGRILIAALPVGWSDAAARLVTAGRSEDGTPAPVRPRPALPAADGADDDRPPLCPVCHRRLVILATHPGHDAAGRPVRRQLWGCPRGHATTYRTAGRFGPLELLEDVFGNDESPEPE